MNTFGDGTQFSNWKHCPIKLVSFVSTGTGPMSPELSHSPSLQGRAASDNGELNVLNNPINNPQPLIGKPITERTFLRFLPESEPLYLVPAVSIM